MIDLGMAAKTRPVLILSIAPGPADRQLVTFVYRTIHPKGGNYEVPHPAQQLAGFRFEKGAFVCNAIATEDKSHFQRRLTVVSAPVLLAVEAKVKTWLAL